MIHLWQNSPTRQRFSTALKGSESPFRSFDEFDRPSPSRRFRVSHFTVGQTLAIAAGSSSLAAILTALFAAYFLSNQYGAFTGALVSSSTHLVSANHAPKESDAAPLIDLETLSPTSLFLRAKAHKERVRNELFGDRLSDSIFPANLDSGLTEEKSLPKVAWLISFPNSGTSFTLHSTREASNCTTATNYALEGEIKDEPSVPAIAGGKGENGPWLELIPDRSTNNQPKYILTKTHCGGFCHSCPQDRYLETPRSFEIACRSGNRAVRDKKGRVTLEPMVYDSSLVKKAIHIIRHPLDNIVARFHLDYNRALQQGNASFAEEFPNNRTGFDSWCKFHDDQQELVANKWFDKDLMKALKGVPCKAEFYRYVQWHNLAFSTTRDMGIETLVVHYNDYRDDFEQTLKRILVFLEQPREGEGIEFHPGKEYRDFYSSGQKKAVRTFLKEVATRETWKNLEAYSFSDT